MYNKIIKDLLNSLLFMFPFLINRINGINRFNFDEKVLSSLNIDESTNFFIMYHTYFLVVLFKIFVYGGLLFGVLYLIRSIINIVFITVVKYKNLTKI